MRMVVVLKGREHNYLNLPLNYNQILQGFIYRNIDDGQFSTFLHNEGFQSGNKKFKLFTFSRLKGAAKVDSKQKVIRFNGKVTLEVSSILPTFIQNLGQSLLQTENLYLNNNKISIEKVAYSAKSPEQTASEINMLSPITVYSTLQNPSGKKLTHYYNPDDQAFSMLIEKHLLSKYEAFYKKPSQGYFKIKKRMVNRQDKIISSFKGFIINGWLGEYSVEASNDLFEFAYHVGLCPKASQGFGMFKLS